MRRILILAACLLLIGAKQPEVETDVDTLIAASGPTLWLSPDSPVELEPIRHFSMDDDAASTAVVDKSGNGNAVAGRNTQDFNGTGKISGALDFDNGDTDDTVTTDYSCNLGAVAHSECMWTQFDDAGESNGCRLADCNNLAGAWLCGGSGTNICYKFGTQLVSTGTITINGTAWTHICTVHEAGGTGYIYINGALDSSGATGTTGQAANFLIGNNAASDRACDGRIDDVRFYNRALTPTEVSRIYNAGTGHQLQSTGVRDAIVVDASGNIGSWVSKGSVASVEFANSTDAGKPQISKIGNRRAIIWDGGDSLTSTTALSGVLLDHAKTAIAVAQATTIDADTPLFADSSSKFILKTHTTGSGVWKISNDDGAADIIEIAGTDAKPVVLVARHDGTYLSAEASGVQGTGVASGNTDALTGTLQLGVLGATYFTGYAGPLLLWNKALPNSVLLPIERGLASRYGVSLASATAETSCNNYIASLTPTLWLDSGTEQEIGPVRHYKLEDNAANTTVVDSAGNGNGTANVNTSGLTAAGKISNGFDFYAGSADHVIDTGLACSAFDGATNWSACVWLMPDGAGEGGAGRIFNCGNTVKLLQCATGANLCFNNGTELVSAGTIDIAGATWSHVCVVHAANGTGSIYINGVLDKSGANGTGSSGANLLIGGNTAADRSYDGHMDDIRLFNYAITSAQVSALYNSGNGHQQAGTRVPSASYPGLVVLDEDGAGVYAWQSRSSAVEFVQATAANQPTIAGQGVDFELTGDADGMTSTSTLDDLFNSDAKSLLAVVKTESTAANGDLLGDNSKFLSQFRSIGPIFRVVNADAGGADVTAGTSTADNTLYVIESTHDGVNVTSALNGGTVSSQASGATSAMNVTMKLSSTSDGFDGLIMQILTDDSVWSADTRARVRSCLGQRYGISF